MLFDVVVQPAVESIFRRVEEDRVIRKEILLPKEAHEIFKTAHWSDHAANITQPTRCRGNAIRPPRNGLVATDLLLRQNLKVSVRAGSALALAWFVSVILTPSFG